MFGLDYDLSPVGAHISRVHEKNGVMEGYFYVVALESSLRFPLPDVIIEILNEYGIAPSHSMPNSECILAVFFLGCKSMAIVPLSRVFKLFIV